MHRLIVIAGAAFLATVGSAQAKPGDLDRSFADNGRAAFKVFGSGGGIAGLALIDGRRPLLSISAYRDGQIARGTLHLTSRGRLARQTVLPAPDPPSSPTGTR